jgi:hypothetical protein
MNSRVDLIIGALALVWSGTALLYIRKHPDKLTGITYSKFRLLCFGIMALGLAMLAAGPFIKR